MHITTNTFVNKLHVHTYFFLFKIYIMWCVMCMHNNNVRQCSRKNGVYYVHILTLHFPISIYAILKSTTFYIPSCANLSSHIHTLTHAITHTHIHTYYNTTTSATTLEMDYYIQYHHHHPHHHHIHLNLNQYYHQYYLTTTTLNLTYYHYLYQHFLINLKIDGNYF